MALDPSNSSSLEQLALKGLICGAEMKAGEHVTLPTYVNYTFNIATGLEDSADLEQLYALAFRSSPPRDTLKLCNGMFASATIAYMLH